MTRPCARRESCLRRLLQALSERKVSISKKNKKINDKPPFEMSGQQALGLKLVAGEQMSRLKEFNARQTWITNEKVVYFC